MRSSILLAVFVSLLGLGSNASTAAKRLYWGDINSDEIRYVTLDGHRPGVAVGSPSAVGLTLDANGEQLYWIDDELKVIRRCNLDGSQVEDVVQSGLETPRGLAIDRLGLSTQGTAKLYWTDEATRSIRRANLDGTAVETLVTGLASPRQIALDHFGGKMYWADSGSDRIQRANLDGSLVEDLVTHGLHLPRGIALDVRAGKVYWTDGSPDRIQRSNLDGSDVQTLISSGLHIVRGIALDTRAGKMYWCDAGTNKIQRAGLNGSQVEDVVTETPHPWSIALETPALRLPRRSLRIVADIDGSDRLRIDRDGAAWIHKHAQWPHRVYLNGVQWSPHDSKRLPNTGPTQFLPDHVDFESARLRVRQGRDTVVLQDKEDGIVLHFADTPNGRATYDVTIRFGAPPKK